MRPDESSAGTGLEPDVANAGDRTIVAARPSRLRLAAAVMFVTELERSVAFYRELLGWTVTVRDNTAALLVGPDGSQLYLRSMGTNAQHPLGNVGIQYLIWAAEDEADLRRCERILRAQSTQVSSQDGDGFTVVEGRGPDNVPVLVTSPGPESLQLSPGAWNLISFVLLIAPVTVWLALAHMFPAADVPVVQLSINATKPWDYTSSWVRGWHRCPGREC